MVSEWNKGFTPMVFYNQKREDFFNAVEKLYHQMRTSKSQDSSTMALSTDYRKLCEFFKPFRGDGPALVIALDEAQELMKWRGGSGNGYSPAHILGRVIRECSAPESGPDVWVVFSSTSYFAAPAVIHSLQRMLDDGLPLFPPFSALEWDIFAAPVKELSVLSVGSYEDVISFGRPL
ncbi:hypothetical protein VKT23_016028 [Stygiomarasmius scandens]|uniref:Uncharacterized protein n=1 Tax=Marasmiellus scandens TaxID=2682957 RepID=A0ABR1IWE0_9AGAR